MFQDFIRPLKQHEDEQEEQAIEQTTAKITPTFENIDLLLTLHLEFEHQLK